MCVDLDQVELAIVVNLEILREVLHGLSFDGRRWWISSDPSDAAAKGYISIGYGDPGCVDRLNTLHFRVPVLNDETPTAGADRLVLLVDEATSYPEEPGYYLEDNKVVEDPFTDLMSFFEPLRRALIARLQSVS